MSTIPPDQIQSLQNAVVSAVDAMKCENQSLFQLSAHEQAISHRIALYLEQGLSKMPITPVVVDCEYNKHLKNSKVFNVNERFFEQYPNCHCSSCTKHREAHSDQEQLPDERDFRPDIVAHTRGNDDNNVIAIEVKKASVCPFDLAKLEALTLPKKSEDAYGYSLGVFIFFRDCEAQYRWFIDGIMYE